MYLILSMVLSALLGFVLFIIEPLAGGIIAFGIVVGCTFRGLYLLTDIHKRMSSISPSKSRVEKAYEDYLENRDSQS
ncbi:hypothetical protein IM538_12635 [Cytobacillus suaedae]|nr:hypothetical protein IM538_12635 [Cytobacillus suaedae]